MPVRWLAGRRRSRTDCVLAQTRLTKPPYRGSTHGDSVEDAILIADEERPVDDDRRAVAVGGRRELQLVPDLPGVEVDGDEKSRGARDPGQVVVDRSPGVDGADAEVDRPSFFPGLGIDARRGTAEVVDEEKVSGLEYGSG